MANYDELVKHLMDRFSDAFAALALNTAAVEVLETLTTEHPTIKVHHSDMTFRVRLLDFRNRYWRKSCKSLLFTNA